MNVLLIIPLLFAAFGAEISTRTVSKQVDAGLESGTTFYAYPVDDSVALYRVGVSVVKGDISGNMLSVRCNTNSGDGITVSISSGTGRGIPVFSRGRVLASRGDTISCHHQDQKSAPLLDVLIEMVTR